MNLRIPDQYATAAIDDVDADKARKRINREGGGFGEPLEVDDGGDDWGDAPLFGGGAK